MNCQCALAVIHNLKPSQWPLLTELEGKPLNHRLDRCKWDCCGEAWSTEVCTSARAKQLMDPDSVLSKQEKEAALQFEKEQAKEAEQHERLNPPPSYPSDDGRPENISDRRRRLKDASDARSAELDAVQEGGADAEKPQVQDDKAADGASFFGALADALNPVPLMETIGETTVNGADAVVAALGSLAGVGKDYVIVPIITPLFGVDRKELDETMNGLTEANDKPSAYKKLLTKAAELYVDMLSMNESDVEVVMQWIDAAVKAWISSVGLRKPLIRVPFGAGVGGDDDVLSRLIAELDSSVSSDAASYAARLSLSATLSPTRHLSETVFFDWYVMCRYNDIQFTLPEHSGFPVVADADEYPSYAASSLRSQPAIYALLKDRHTASGFHFDKAIQAALDSPTSRVGCVAGDEESYATFRELYVAVALEAGISAPRLDAEGRGIRVEFWAHGARNDVQTPIVRGGNLDPTYVKAMQIEAGRNIKGFPLCSHVNRAERVAVEKLLTAALGKLHEEGEPYSLGTYLSHKDASVPLPAHLAEEGLGLSRDWPYGRGALVASKQDTLLHVSVNEADHVTVSAAVESVQDVPVSRLFSLWASAVRDIEATLYDKGGFLFMRDPVFGYLSTDPTNTGTAVHLRAVVRLPFLSQPDYGLASLCDRLGLACEKTGEVDTRFSDEAKLRFLGTLDSWLVSFKYRLGCSEAEQMQAFVDGLDSLTTLEKLLAAQDHKGYAAALEKLPTAFYLKALPSSEAPEPDQRKFRGVVTVKVADDVPLFTPKHASAVARVLLSDPGLYFRHIPKVGAAGGWSISAATQSAVECPGCRSGMFLGGEQAYSAYERLLVPVLAQLHKIRDGSDGLRRPFDATRDVHRTDLKLYAVGGLSALDPLYLTRFHVSVSRNIRGVPTAPAISRKLRRTVEQLLYSALSGIDASEVDGKYYSQRDLEGVGAAAVAAELQRKGRLPLLPGPEDHRTVGGVARDWPDARGVFVSSDGIMYMHVNVDDHLKVCYECDGSSDAIGKVMHRLGTNLLALEDALLPSGLTFMHSERLGYLTGDPALLGTAMTTTVTLKLPKMCSQTPKDIHTIADQFDLKVATKGAGVVELSSQRCLGLSEVQLVQSTLDCSLILIRHEKDLEPEPDAALAPAEPEAAPRHSLLEDVQAYIAANPTGCGDGWGVKDNVVRSPYPDGALERAMQECGLTGSPSSVFYGDGASIMNESGKAAGEKIMWIDPFTRTLHWFVLFFSTCLPFFLHSGLTFSSFSLTVPHNNQGLASA